MDDIQTAAPELIGLVHEHASEWSQQYLRKHLDRITVEATAVAARFPRAKVVDLGCTPGHMTFLLGRLGCDVTGVDLDPERERRFYDAAGLRVERCDVEAEDLPVGDADVIVFTEVFEHLRDPVVVLRRIHDALTPGGRIVLTTPNLSSAANVVSMIRGRGFDDPYTEFEKLETVGHMGHVREYTPSQVATFLQRTGFVVDSVEAVRFKPCGRSPRGLALAAAERLLPTMKPYVRVVAHT